MKAMRRAKVFEKADERILGDGDFVKKVLAAAEEKINVSVMTIRKAVQRGEKIVKELNISFL